MNWDGEYFSAKMSELAWEYKEVDKLMDLSASDSVGEMMTILSKIAAEHAYVVQFMAKFSVCGEVTCVFKRMDMK